MGGRPVVAAAGERRPLRVARGRAPDRWPTPTTKAPAQARPPSPRTSSVRPVRLRDDVRRRRPGARAAARRIAKVPEVRRRRPTRTDRPHLCITTNWPSEPRVTPDETRTVVVAFTTTRIVPTVVWIDGPSVCVVPMRRTNSSYRQIGRPVLWGRRRSTHAASAAQPPRAPDRTTHLCIPIRRHPQQDQHRHTSCTSARPVGSDQKQGMHKGSSPAPGGTPVRPCPSLRLG